jgi:dynein heavy chain 2, cytosolic
LRQRFERCTGEGAKLRLEVEQAQAVIDSAESLIGKLHGERVRWSEQVAQLTDQISMLATQSLVAAAFITYLPSTPEDTRAQRCDAWLKLLNVRLSPFEMYRMQTQRRDVNHIVLAIHSFPLSTSASS